MDVSTFGRLVSFVLATHNRRDVLANTLARVHECGLDRARYEIIVVDNVSTDGAAEVAAASADLVVRLEENRGSCAKAWGVERACGEFVVFLDDDSFPHPGAVHRMIQHFERRPRLGAAGFTIRLPDGRREGGALPGVFVGCGVGFRASALREVGGLDASFFMQAEEYDLAFRLAQAGWDVHVFDDIAVEHLKTPTARRSERTTYYDTRNNLRVIARYAPDYAVDAYREDGLQRYGWLAERDGHAEAFATGERDGMDAFAAERERYSRWRLTGSTFERFFCWEYVARRMAALRAGGVNRIVLADLGKNIHAFHRAAELCGVKFLAIGDDRFCGAGRRYRSVPVLGLSEALDLGPDAVVVGNSAPVHATATSERLRTLADLPIHHWFPEISQIHVADSMEARSVADDTCVATV